MRVLLYSDDPILSKGLEALLHEVEGVKLLPVCSTISGAIRRAALDLPDIALLDLTPEIAHAVLGGARHIMRACHVVLWTDGISADAALQAVRLGIRGILNKRSPIDVQIKCLQRVQAGELWFDKAFKSTPPPSRLDTLTAYEANLVRLITQGLRNPEIASVLTIPEAAVKTSLSTLCQKLGVKDRFELTLYGLKHLATVAPHDPGISADALTGRSQMALLKPLTATIQ